MRIACLNQDTGIQPGKEKGAAVHLRAMREAFEHLGADVVPLDEDDDEALRERFRRASAEAPFDLVYERYALGRDLGATLAEEAGVPLVLEVNSPLADEAVRWRDAALDGATLARERHAFESAARVVAVSSQVADYAIERGAARDAVQVFPNGVDTQRFRPRDGSARPRDVRVPTDRLVLGFHGRLRPWHGFENLVEVTRRLLEREVPVHLLVVGLGDFEARMEGILPPERWSRVGWVAHDAVAEYVALFDVLPLTYAPDTPFYFSPLKLAEAMACGVVPVVPLVGDLERVVTPGVDGLLYPLGDLDALTDALESLHRHPAERRRLAAAAVESARGMSWTRVAEFALGRAASEVGGES